MICASIARTGVHLGVLTIALAWPTASEAQANTATTEGPRSQRECTRARARVWQAGEVWRVPATTPACTFDVVESSVVLIPDGQSVGDVGQRVVRDPSGRFITSERSGIVTVWAATGRRERSFGRGGQGPGEFTPGPLNIAPVRGGGLYIFDNAGRWHLFDAQYRHQRTAQFTAFKAPEETAVLDDGQVLDASGRESEAQFFAVMSAMRATEKTRPQVLRRFGNVSPAELQFANTDRARRIAYSTGDRFWAGPPAATGRGYVLEQWHVNGTLLRTLQRSVPWYPEGADRARPGREPSVPPHEIESLWDLGDDLLMVILLAPNAQEWSRSSGRAPDAATRDRMIDIWVEVLDTRSGNVLAQRGPLKYSEAQRTLPTGIFHGSASGFRLELNADDERIARIVSLKLKNK